MELIFKDMDLAIAELATLLVWSQCIKIRDILIIEYWIENRIWSTQPHSGQTISNLMNSNILFICCIFFLSRNESSFILDTEIYYRAKICYSNALLPDICSIPG